MRLRLCGVLLCSSTLAFACQNFPASFVPFASIAYVTAPNTVGDRLVVGALADPTTQQITANIALPTALNEEYCAPVQLGPKNLYPNVYVPTVAERSGNFSAFAGLLLDPVANNQPFPGGIIPLSRLGGIYAWRISAASPLTIITTSLPSATPGVSYVASMVGSGGTPPYTWSATGLPAGITLNSNGNFTGSPASTAAGTFNVTVTLKDGAGATATGQYQLLVNSVAAPLTLVPQQLRFTAAQGGSAPGPQTIAVLGSAVGFTVQVSTGPNAPAAPSWLTVTPLSGTTPTALSVTANPGTLPGGTLNATITVVPNNTSQTPQVVSVTFVIATAPPLLSVAPQTLQYSASFGSSSVQEQTLLARNAGSGSVNFKVAVVGKSTWIKNVTPTSGQTVPNTPVIIKVDVSGQGLAIGAYSDVIQFTGTGAATNIPITLLVRAAGSVLKVGAVGFQFETVQGNPISDTQPVEVINAGDPGTTVNFSASLLSGSDWLSLTVTKNQATNTSPGSLLLKPTANVATLPAGVRTALIQVTDSNAQSSPQLITAVLEVDAATTAAPPDPSPAGVFLVATAGQPKPSSPVVLNYSKAAPASYATSVLTQSGGNWLSVFPTAGQVSASAPANLTLSGNTAGLTTGIYSGTVNVAIGSLLRTLHVTLEVLPGTTSKAGPAARDAATCTPQQLVLVETELADNFVVLAGFPSLLSVQVNDDCGNPVLDATIIAEFDNGDAPLRLDSDQATGFYSASWTPGHVFPGMTITFDATSPDGLLSPSTPTGQISKAAEALNLSAGASRLGGAVAANSNLLPVLSVGGTVNNSNVVLDAPLAPGTIASVYGNQLATSPSGSPGPPLLTQFQGTSIMTGGLGAPLFYVSPQQVNIQIPFELAPNQFYPVVATLNGLSSVPDKFLVAPATPGVIAFPDGTAKAQHGDGSFVTATSPAKPGETLAVYLVGMGLTNPVVASGVGAPFNPHPIVTSPPTVTVDGTQASLQFPGGLVGGSVGLYQINFTVPQGARTGTLNLVVTQNGFTANVTQLIVHP
jgi:uncharacterized protein (TIGR03437 family)